MDSNRLADPYHLESTSSDREIAESCSQYIQILFSADILKEQPDTNLSSAGRVIERFSDLRLFQYSCDYRHKHLEKLNGKGQDIIDKFNSFVESVRNGEVSYASLLLQWIERPNLPSAAQADEGCLRYLLVCAAGAGRLDVVKSLLALRGNGYNFWLEGRPDISKELGISACNTVHELLGKSNDKGRQYQSAFEAAFDMSQNHVIDYLLKEFKRPRRESLQSDWGREICRALGPLPDSLAWDVIYMASGSSVRTEGSS